jgi:hypothetical protein
LTARIEGTSSARIRKAVYAEWAKPKKTKFGIAAADTRIFYTIPAPGEVGVCASDDDSIVVRKPCDEDDDCGNSDCEKKNRVCKTKACSDDIECPSSTCDESGVCASGIVRHVRPCLDDAECPVSDDCDLTGGRCTHNPTLRCDLNAEDLNADCLPAGSLCVSGKCEYSRAAGSFGELAVSTDGVTPPNCGTESACVPADAVLCQPLMLKIQAEGAASVANVYIKKAWDLRWDPDQRQDLISMTVGSDEYLGDLVTRATGSLAEQATECLRDFWYLELDGGDLRWDQRSGSDCDTWAEPATTTTSSSTSTSSSSTSSTSTSSTTL